ncbi:MAG: siphovirus Gp157 family protein [Pseudorhodoplanes sp.]|nr:siphovirus Gp157 family protein [Pseudorhodoplanes sp.]
MNLIALSKIQYEDVKRRIQQDHPDLDEETLADTVDGLSTLPDILAAIIRSALADEALASGLKGRVEDMQDRLQRLSERASARRAIARDVMVDADLRKITAPDFTASIRAGSSSLLVIDETQIPHNYWEPREPKLNRQALLTDLKLQGQIAGVALSQPEPTLTVRTR